MTFLRDPVAVELAQTIGTALESAIAGKPYAEVIRTSIDPDKTPDRVFFQAQDGRWD